MSLLYMARLWAGLLIGSVSYFRLQSNSFMDSFYSKYNNCFPVKLVVLNPLLNAVRYDMSSPDWLRRRLFICFRRWSVSKNKPICYFAWSRLLLDILMINQINAMLAHCVVFVCHAGTYLRRSVFLSRNCYPLQTWKPCGFCFSGVK